MVAFQSCSFFFGPPCITRENKGFKFYSYTLSMRYNKILLKKMFEKSIISVQTENEGFHVCILTTVLPESAG